jgi:hypothetical protein
MLMKESTFWALAVSYVLFIALGCLFGVLNACSDPPKGVKSRVAVMPKAPEPPPVPPPAALKEERVQVTNVGRVVNVGVEHQDLLNSEGWYMSLIFQEDGGFQKKFFPVCLGQNVQAGRPVSIMYHWHPWQNDPSAEHPNSIGCYVIDGYQMDGKN